MCSIFGAIGKEIDPDVIDSIRSHAQDRGRDGGRVEYYKLGNGLKAVLGNWRATPTTEVDQTDFQPYQMVVHNGTIANDKALGNPEGVVDSKIISKVIDRRGVHALAQSLKKLIGSYALGIVSLEHSTLYLACNYKPIYYYKIADAIYFSSMERHFDNVLLYGTRPCKVAPYSILELWSGITLPIEREDTNKALVICSGGLDSTCVAAEMKYNGYDVSLLHFVYGCRAERKELEAMMAIRDKLKMPLKFLPIDYDEYKGKSPLFDKTQVSGPVAGAEFAHEWVPARNLMMLTHAVAYAEANHFTYIALGNNLEESGAYPDNEEEFTHLFNQVLPYAVHDGGKVEVKWPLGNLMKHEIVAAGIRNGTPFEDTWSCYNNGDISCGVCGPCFMRRMAFQRNGIVDPLPYEVSFEDMLRRR